MTRSVTSRTVSEHRRVAHVRSFLSALVAFCQPPKRIAIFQRYPGSKMAGRVSVERQTLSSFFLRLTLSISFPLVAFPSLSHIQSFCLCLSIWLPLYLTPRTTSFLSLFFVIFPSYVHTHIYSHMRVHICIHIHIYIYSFFFYSLFLLCAFNFPSLFFSFLFLFFLSLFFPRLQLSRIEHSQLPIFLFLSLAK